MNIHQKIKLYYGFKFLQNAHFFAAVLVPFFTVWAGLTTQTVLFIQSWFMISVTLLEVPTGVIADRFGRKTSLTLGAFFSLIGFALYGLIPNLYLFLLCEFILALAMAFISGADEAWLIDTLAQHHLEERKIEIIGIGQSAMFTGMMVGSLLGSLIASKISLNAAVYLTAIPAFFLFIIAARMPEPIITKAKGEVFRWKQAFSSLKLVITQPVLRLLSINLILVAVPAYFVIWLYQPLLQSIGVDIIWFGLIHSLFIGAEIIISHRFSWLERKVGFTLYLRLSALLTAISFFMLVVQVSLPTILLFLLFAGGFGLTRRYFGLAKFHDFVPSMYRASIASSFSLLLRLTLALTNLLVGWLFVRSIDGTLLLLGLLALGAVFFLPNKTAVQSK